MPTLYMLKENLALYKTALRRKEKKELSDADLDAQRRLKGVEFPPSYSPFSDFDEGLHEAKQQLLDQVKLDSHVVGSIRTTLDIVSFYRHVHTKKYFISCFNPRRHGHPHMELICGIIIAAVLENRKYTIVLSSRDASLKKKLELFAFVLRGRDHKWRELVAIDEPPAKQPTKWKHLNYSSCDFEY